MGIFTFTIGPDRPEPLSFSVVRVGDTRERFIRRNDRVISFDEDSGPGIVYTSKITDANGNVSSENFTLGCDRPADCQEGPDLQRILAFDGTKISYEFHGVNVFQIERQVISENGIIVDSVIDIPSGPVVESVFQNPLSRGRYTLKIRGKSCYSEDTNGLPFEITDDPDTVDWWPNYPMFDFDEVTGKFRILVAVTRTDTYPIEIRDSSNAIIVAGTVTLTPGQVEFWPGFDPDTYDIVLGPLTGTLVIDVPPAECTEGPELLAVTPISPIQTEFEFHGVDVFQIEWFIRNLSDVILQRSIVAPGGSKVTITHDPLAGGSYNLLIKGSSCTSETGIVDNLDFVVPTVSLNITSVTVEQQSDGRYKLTVNFVGGTPNYTITVRTLANVTLGSFPNTTGSPANVVLPSGTIPQTVKVMVMDVNNNVDEETAVILPAPAMKMTFLQASTFGGTPTRTPMEIDGSIFFIGSAADYNFDVEASLPNGGLWDYIEKRLRKKVGSDLIEKSIQAATGQPQNYVVPAGTSTERMLMPRNANAVTIDGQNIFKTGGEWEFRAIARKGGVSGSIIAQLTRTFIVSTPGVGSGIYLYNRSGNTLGSMISEINQTGSSFPKPVPHFDFAFNDFGGITFYGFAIYLRQKVGNSFVNRASNNFFFPGGRTSIAASEYSLFSDNDPADPAYASLFVQEPGIWSIEVQGWNAALDQVIGTRSAIFDFTVNTSVEQGFINRGTKKTVIGSKSYQQINGIDFGSEILPSGNVKIFYPTSRRSLNGSQTVYPWVYLNHVRLSPTSLAALRGSTGMAMPNGIHSFSVKWHSNVVSDYDDVIDGGGAGGPYQLAGEVRSLSYMFSGMDDYFTVTIRDL